jgi:hypothetical protein
LWRCYRASTKTPGRVDQQSLAGQISERRFGLKKATENRKGENVGINRWSDIEERKRNETDAKAGNEIPAEKKGDASSRMQVSEEPTENEEKREVVEKLKVRERDSS